MLVYANRLQVHGEASESVVFRAIGGWLKEQLGFGLSSGAAARERSTPGPTRRTAVAAPDRQLLRGRESVHCRREALELALICSYRPPLNNKGNPDYEDPDANV